MFIERHFSFLKVDDDTFIYCSNWRRAFRWGRILWLKTDQYKDPVSQMIWEPGQEICRG